VPTISRFYGIVIRMWFDDHPVPHFHAEYGEYSAKVSIASGAILNGYLPPRIRRMVRYWARVHTLDLVENWGRLSLHLQPRPIEPLP